MNEKARQARAAYKRKWQQENKDKVRAYQEKYWTKKAEQAEQAASEVKGLENFQDINEIKAGGFNCEVPEVDFATFRTN